MRGHPAVPRRSFCAAKALAVDLGYTGIGVSPVHPLCLTCSTYCARGNNAPCMRQTRQVGEPGSGLRRGAMGM